jgi:hypothetical protein
MNVRTVAVAGLNILVLREQDKLQVPVFQIRLEVVAQVLHQSVNIATRKLPAQRMELSK